MEKTNRLKQAEECRAEGEHHAAQCLTPEAAASVRRTFERLAKSYELMHKLGV